MLFDARPDQASTSVDILAYQLRAHLLHRGVYYVELHPNLALANSILNGPVPPNTIGQPPSPNVGEVTATVVGSDDRMQQPATTYPFTTIAFSNSRGSAFKISPHAAYTAAHVVYDTFGNFGIPPNGFFCADGNTTTSEPGCTLSSWRFGVEGTTGVSAWLPAPLCYDLTVPSAYVAETAEGTNIWQDSRWDYAAIGLVTSASCNLGNTGTLGTTTFFPSPGAVSFSGAGYAEYVPCPDNSDGKGTADCMGGMFQLTPMAAPFTGAHLWKQNGIPSVTVGEQLPANTAQTLGDVTNGNSGGPLYYYSADDGVYYAVGVASHTLRKPPRELNVYERWTPELYQFFSDNTPFPQ